MVECLLNYVQAINWATVIKVEVKREQVGNVIVSTDKIRKGSGMRRCTTQAQMDRGRRRGVVGRSSG